MDMKRLTAVLLIAGLMAPGVALGGACCYASAPQPTPSLERTASCCPDGAPCGLSADACGREALREPQAISAGASTRPSFPAFFTAESSLTIRSWWARKVRLASADPPESFHPVISLPLRL